MNCLLAVAAATALSLSPIAIPTTALASPESAPDAEPSVETGQCLVSVPSGSRCGLLVVPENRAVSDSRKIKIPYVVVPARGGTATKPPLVFMGGGPGSGTIQLAGYLSYNVALGNRDVVLLEQRGGERSQPDLACPAADSRLADMFTRTDDPYAEAEPVATAMRDCLDTFKSSGGDPRGYTAGEAALDLRDLRVALGYQRWSPYGLSWSTGVMARLAQLDPSGVDSVVLDSFSPPDVDLAQNAYDGLRLSLAELGKQPGSALRDPGADLATAIAKLNAHPQEVAGHQPVTHKATTFRLTGDDLVTLVHSAAYDVELLPVIPLLLHRLAAGEFGVLRTLVAVGIKELVSHDLGQYWVMQCQDEVPYRTTGARHPRPVIAWLAADDVVCAKLGLPRSPAATSSSQAGAVPNPAATRQPVRFDQPTLVLAGAEDPITPATVADKASAGLSHRKVITFAGVGHAVMLSSSCGRRIVADWLIDPGNVDTACSQQPPYSVVQPDSLHSTTRVAAVGAAAADGRPLGILPAVLFTVMVALWALGLLVWLAIRWIYTRPIKAGLVISTPALIGVVFLAAFAATILPAYDELRVQLLLGVPPLTPWTGLLLPLGLVATIYAATRVRTERLKLVALGCASVTWIAATVWFAAVVVAPS